MGVPVALTISASDPSGASGVQADLKAFDALGVYGTSVLSAVTAQSTRGFFAREDVPLSLLKAQLEAVLADFPPRAVKVGLLASVPALRLAARLLPPSGADLVVDPVLETRDGAPLLRPASLLALTHDLLPLAALLVVGPVGASALARRDVSTPAEAKAAAMRLVALGARAVLVTGARSEGTAPVDGLLDGKTWHRFEAPSDCPATALSAAPRGTFGKRQTLSAAVTAWLARGQTLPEAVSLALDYVRRAVRFAPGLGEGAGPLGHRAAGPRDA